MGNEKLSLNPLNKETIKWKPLQSTGCYGTDHKIRSTWSQFRSDKKYCNQYSGRISEIYWAVQISLGNPSKSWKMYQGIPPSLFQPWFCNRTTSSDCLKWFLVLSGTGKCRGCIFYYCKKLGGAFTGRYKWQVKRINFKNFAWIYWSDFWSSS